MTQSPAVSQPAATIEGVAHFCTHQVARFCCWFLSILQYLLLLDGFFYMCVILVGICKKRNENKYINIKHNNIRPRQQQLKLQVIVICKYFYPPCEKRQSRRELIFVYLCVFTFLLHIIACKNSVASDEWGNKN